MAATPLPAWCEASPLLRLALPEEVEGDEDDDCSPALKYLADALPQLNLAMGLRSAAYDEQQYMALLRACRSAYAQRADALEEAQRIRNAASMRLEAHTLCGSLRCIGAETLSRHAAELELAIYDGQATQVRIQAPAFLAELRGFVRQLRRCFEPTEVAVPDLSSYPPLWQSTIAAMGQKVTQYDCDGALALLQSLQWAHAPEDGPWLAAVRRALEAFDYDTLSRLLQALP
ncbi:MAG: Hpt domain-containing protein, partial [Clostridia bacterium]|nr:Hpt domain-containing protein [Clostridia bacterium]